MTKGFISAVALAVVAPLTGCSALLGPSCGEYVGATAAQQQQMALDWLVFNGDVPAGSSVTEVSTQVEWALDELAASCTSSTPYYRLHMFRPESLPR